MFWASWPAPDGITCAAGADLLGGLQEGPHEVRVAGGGDRLRQGREGGGATFAPVRLAHQSLEARLMRSSTGIDTSRKLEGHLGAAGMML